MTTAADPPDSPSERAGLDDADYLALGDFRLAIRRFLAFSAQGASDLGLTSNQHQALLAIKTHRGEEPISVGELADSLLIKNHSAFGLVSRLVQRGFAERSESLVDRRRAIVTLTPAGEAVLEAISMRNLGELRRATRILETILKTTRKLGAR